MSGASGNFQEQERACTWISKNNIVKKIKNWRYSPRGSCDRLTEILLSVKQKKLSHLQVLRTHTCTYTRTVQHLLELPTRVFYSNIHKGDKGLQTGSRRVKNWEHGIS